MSVHAFGNQVYRRQQELTHGRLRQVGRGSWPACLAWLLMQRGRTPAEQLAMCCKLWLWPGEHCCPAPELHQ